jgi:hypothetical protein
MTDTKALDDLLVALVADRTYAAQRYQHWLANDDQALADYFLGKYGGLNAAVDLVRKQLRAARGYVGQGV